MIKPIPHYIDHLWYPILVKRSSGGYDIVEMQGKVANDWNYQVAQESRFRTTPSCII